MITLMSSGARAKACLKFSGHSRLVMRRLNHDRSARAKASAALYQWRLLALTLPMTTLFFSTAADAVSAVAILGKAPLEPIPARHTTPFGPILEIDSAMTDPTPVHSRIMSGAKPKSATLQV